MVIRVGVRTFQECASLLLVLATVTIS